MRRVLGLAAAMALWRCATLPAQEAAVVECEGNAAGEIRNCVLISQSLAGSDFGPAAVQTASRGVFRGPAPDGWRKFRTTFRGWPEGPRAEGLPLG